jgi:hypothetical protein
MKKNYLIHSTILIVFLILSGKLIAQNTYTNSTHGFSIDFPSGWIQKQSKVEHTIIKASNSTSNIIQYLSIGSYSITETEANKITTATSSKAFDLVKAMFGSEAMTLEKTGDATMAGINMHWAKLSFDLNGKMSHYKVFYFTKKETLFRFTYCCDGDQTNFDTGLKLFEESLKTLKFS